MIKSAVIAMTLLGCDCDAKVCTYIGETSPQWETIAGCEAAMKSQVLTRSNLDYPLVTAECRSVAGEPAVIDVRSQTPVASIEPQAQGMAGQVADRTVATFRRTAAGYEAVKTGVYAAADGLLDRANNAIATTAGWLRY